MKETAPYATVLVRLLKGPLYSDSGEAWDLLFRHRTRIELWFAEIALELVVAEHDGLAFIRRRRPPLDIEGVDVPDDSGKAIPELVARRELPYRLSLLCVLLVEELYRFEAGSSDESRLVMSRQRIRELLIPYLPKRSNEAKLVDDIDRQISKLEAYGFLRRLSQSSDEFEVTKLLKHKISADVLEESLEKLKGYSSTASVTSGESDE